MSRCMAKAHPTVVIFYCRKCEHPLQESWNDVEGLMKPTNDGDDHPFDGYHTFCPGCGTKNWFPRHYTRH